MPTQMETISQSPLHRGTSSNMSSNTNLISSPEDLERYLLLDTEGNSVLGMFLRMSRPRPKHMTVAKKMTKWIF